MRQTGTGAPEDPGDGYLGFETQDLLKLKFKTNDKNANFQNSTIITCKYQNNIIFFCFLSILTNSDNFVDLRII